MKFLKIMKKKVVVLGIIFCALMLGVEYTLNKPTAISRYVYTRDFATSANPAFEDENFYACIIDQYNDDFDTELAYNYKLSDENLAKITHLYCDKDIKSISGIEKLTNLRSLSLYGDNTDLTTVDISKNTELWSLTIGMPVKEIVPSETLESLSLFVFGNTNYDLTNFPALDSVSLHAADTTSSVPLSTLNTIKNRIESLSVTDFAGELSLNYSDFANLKYLYLNKMTVKSLVMPDSVTLLSVSELNLKPGFLGDKNYANMRSVYASNMSIANIDYNKFANVTSLSFDRNDVSNLKFNIFPSLTYLYINECDLSNIDLSSNLNLYTIDLENNKLTNIDVSKLSELSSLKLAHNNITSLDISNNPKLGNLSLDENKLVKELGIYKNTTVDFANDLGFVKYYKMNDTKYLSGDLKTTTGDWKYNDEDYYYTWKPKNGSKYMLSSSDASAEITDNKIKFTKVGDYTIDASYITNYTSASYYADAVYKGTYKVHVIELTSDRYHIDYDNNWIFVGSDKADVIQSNVDVGLATVKIENNKLQVLYNKEVLKEFTIYNIDFGNLNAGNGYILIDEAVSYSDFVSNINPSNGITYKIFNGETQITEGDIELGSILKVYKDGSEISSYKITNEFIDMSQFKIDEDKKIIRDLQLGTTIRDFKNKISTSGNITIVNTKGEQLTDDKLIATGAKVSIILSSETIEYTLSVLGDCTGDGVVKINDVTKAYQGFKNKISLSEQDFMAVDVSKDGFLKINDITKLYQFFKGKISAL